VKDLNEATHVLVHNRLLVVLSFFNKHFPVGKIKKKNSLKESVFVN